MDMDSKAWPKWKASRHVNQLFKEELQGSKSEVNPEKAGDFEFQLEQEELKVVPPNHSQSKSKSNYESEKPLAKLYGQLFSIFVLVMIVGI